MQKLPVDLVIRNFYLDITGINNVRHVLHSKSFAYESKSLIVLSSCTQHNIMRVYQGSFNDRS